MTLAASSRHQASTTRAGGSRTARTNHPSPVASVPTRRARSASQDDRTARLPPAAHPSDLIRLCALLVVEDAGPVIGLDALNQLAPLARKLGEVAPTYPLLHELEADGHLLATQGLPRVYRITTAGRREASRLAAGSVRTLTERLGPEARLEALLATHR